MTAAPLFLAYDYSFRTPTAATREEPLVQAYERGAVRTDEFFLHPDPCPSRETWCDVRVRLRERHLAACDPTGPTRSPATRRRPDVEDADVEVSVAAVPFTARIISSRGTGGKPVISRAVGRPSEIVCRRCRRTGDGGRAEAWPGRTPALYGEFDRQHMPSWSPRSSCPPTARKHHPGPARRRSPESKQQIGFTGELGRWGQPAAGRRCPLPVKRERSPRSSGGPARGASRRVVEPGVGLERAGDCPGGASAAGDCSLNAR